MSFGSVEPLAFSQLAVDSLERLMGEENGGDPHTAQPIREGQFRTSPLLKIYFLILPQTLQGVRDFLETVRKRKYNLPKTHRSL